MAVERYTLFHNYTTFHRCSTHLSHYTFFVYFYYDDATLTFNLSVIKHLNVQPVNINAFDRIRYKRKESETKCSRRR